MFHLSVRLTNLQKDEYELYLHHDTFNHTMWLASDDTYAKLKTKAAAIFKTTLTWDDAAMKTASVASM